MAGRRMQVADMMTIRLSMAALFVIAAVLPSSSAAAVLSAEDECLQKLKCAEQSANPVRLAQCKDNCAQEADFEVANAGLIDCDAACQVQAKGGGEAAVGKCMEPCTAKVDVAAAAVATRSCYRRCAIDPATAGDVKGCQARCEATADKELDGCFKKCAGEAGADVARVFACNAACPFDAVTKQVWTKN